MAELNFDGRPNNTPVGYFTYLVGDDVWSWSDGMYELHGYEPRSLPATTDLLLRHKHPDDALRAFESLETVISDGRPFSCYHRIVTAKDHVRYVLSVGRGLFGSEGRVEEVTGYFIDFTGVRESTSPSDDESSLVRVSEARSMVDQAKGIVMVAVGCDDAAAFATLRTWAVEKEMKLSDLARQLVEQVAVRPLADDNACRSALDEWLSGLSS